MFILIISLLTNDSLRADSLVEDTIKIQKSPQTLSSNLTSALDTILYSIKFITPKDYEIWLPEVLLRTGSAINVNGYITEVSSPFKENFLLNGHIIENPLFGKFNLIQLPNQFFETITIAKDDYGAKGRVINLVSKFPRYTLPFSHIYFTLLSNNAIYNIDFTRPISNNLFFYLSGVYSNIFQPPESLYLKTNGIYANLSYNQFTPINLNFIYTANNYGQGFFLSLCDGSLSLGDKNHRLILYYTLNNYNLKSATDDSFIDNHMRNLGAVGNSSFKIGIFKLGMEIEWLFTNLNSEIYGNKDIIRVILNPNLKGALQKFVFGLSMQNRIDKENSYQFNPGFNLGYEFFDSLFLIGSIQKNTRMPAIFQKLGLPPTFGLSFVLNPNTSLKPENLFIKEVGIKKKDVFLNYYEMSIDNVISYEKDSSGYYTARNHKNGFVSGLEAYLEVPLISNFLLEISSNYQFKNSSINSIPKANFNIIFLWHRRTDRFSFDFGPQLRYVGERYDLNGREYKPFYTLSAVSAVRFISLSFSAIIDNILSENPVDYSYAGRKFSFVVKWEFWD